jgi:hypothetical protein
MINRCAMPILTLLLLLLPSSMLAAKAADKAPDEVQDLRYGVVLYHFFQQAYFDALTETLVGEQRLDMPYHADSAKLLRGGMSLSYGMGQQAEAIFDQLLATIEQPSQRDRAWFYLAKLYYSRGEKAHAGEVLGNISGALAPALQQEVNYLSANIALLAGDSDEAEQHIARLPDDSPWLAYFLFNRGAGETVAGDWKSGVESFRQMHSIQLATEEGRSLHDRAAIAAGYAYLGGGEYQLAIKQFLAVRLESPLVEKAMLGYGWAAAQQQDYVLALSPWQALSQRSVMDASVQESLLAVPYAYEKLDAKASALEQYQRAIRVFEQELVKLAEAITVFNELPLIQLVADEDGLSTDWIMGRDYLPINDQAPYLSHLISRQYFQSAVKQLSDLITMREYLSQAETRLQALQGVLDFQQQVWRDNLGQSQREEFARRYQQLVVLEQQLRQQQLEANRRGDGSLYLSVQQTEQWQIIQHASDLIEQLTAAGKDVSNEQQQLQRYKGLLLWQLSEQESSRSWQFEKQLRELQSALQEAKSRVDSVAQLNDNRYDAAFASRVQSLQQRLIGQQTELQLAFQQSEQSIRELAINELTTQQQRLGWYLAQAKLAVARLYDIGSQEIPQ